VYAMCTFQIEFLLNNRVSTRGNGNRALLA
jgi:hypothetical protein